MRFKSYVTGKPRPESEIQINIKDSAICEHSGLDNILMRVSYTIIVYNISVKSLMCSN